jgi:hypothetical protein
LTNIDQNLIYVTEFSVDLPDTRFDENPFSNSGSETHKQTNRNDLKMLSSFYALIQAVLLINIMNVIS